MTAYFRPPWRHVVRVNNWGKKRRERGRERNKKKKGKIKNKKKYIYIVVSNKTCFIHGILCIIACVDGTFFRVIIVVICKTFLCWKIR